MDDVNLRLEFHRAIDAVTPQAPWLGDHVRRELRRQESVHPRPRRRWSLILSPSTRRILAGALVVILALAATEAALAIYRYTHGPIPVRPHSGAVLRECGEGGVYMVDANVGWQGTQRSTDGGQTWRDVSPPPLPGSLGKQPGASCALDAQHAWVAAGSGSTSYQPDRVVVLSTVDGGLTWQQLGVIAVGFPVSWKNNFAVELDFLDDDHGWLLIEYASTPTARDLYSTSDGGVHWARVSRSPGLGLGNIAAGCAENGIMFNGLQRGWLAWDCSRGYGDQQSTSGPVIALTSDGGRSWAPLSLQAYPAGRKCTASTPIFSEDHGLLEVSCLGDGAQGGWAAVYSTADGGRTWAPHLLRIWTLVDIVDGKTAFFFEHTDNANTLYRTTDGGVNWYVVASGIFTESTVGSLVFINQLDGFARVSNSPVPWWTHDGGKTWVTADGRRQVGNVVCTLPSDRNTSPSLTLVKMVSATTGWAAGARRTTDGGANWINTNPPKARLSTSGYGEFFLDSVHAWVAETVGSTKACSDRFLVFRTVDGGATWQQGASVPIQVQGFDQSDGSWGLRLYFIDADHGWLRIAPIYGLAPVGLQGPLYRTTDGGRHWTFVASQVTQSDRGCEGRGDFVFSSPTTGWMSANCPTAPDSGLDVLVTRDGGQTWALQSLFSNYCNIQYFPSGCANPVPKFFDSSNGWVLDKDAPLLLMTSDAGMTWTRHGLPSLPTFSCTGKYGEPETCTDQSIVAASFIDPNQGWAIIGKYDLQRGLYAVRFEHTSDGGKSWAALSSNLVSSSGIPDLSQATLTFVDQSNAFLWTGTALFRTTDGGHTWQAPS